MLCPRFISVISTDFPTDIEMIFSWFYHLREHMVFEIFWQRVSDSNLHKLACSSVSVGF